MNSLFQVLLFHTEVLTEFLYNKGKPLKLKDIKFINKISECVIDYSKLNDTDKYNTTNLENLLKDIDNTFVGNKQQDPSRFYVIKKIYLKKNKYDHKLNLKDINTNITKNYAKDGINPNPYENDIIVLFYIIYLEII